MSDEQNTKNAGVPGMSMLQKVIVDIWSQTLDTQLTSVDDHFFELGGRSVQVVQCVFTLSEILNVELTPEQVFDAPTIALYSQSIVELDETDEEELQEICELYMELKETPTD